MAKSARLLAHASLLALTSAALVTLEARPGGEVTTLPSGAASLEKVASCVKAPPLPTGGTRFGTSVSTSSTSFRDALSSQDRRFGRLDAVRVFRSSAPPSNTWDTQGDLLANRTVVSSFKVPPAKVLSGSHDSAFLRYFRTVPSDVRVFWSYYHEPEAEIRDGDFSAYKYRAAFRHLVDLAQRACKPNLHPTLILTGWTSESASGRDWRDYYPGSDYISVLAWDPYNGASHRATDYRSPSSMLDGAVNISRQAGKPFGIAETGSIRVSGDSSGEKRARWLNALATYLVDRRARFVTYWDSVGGPLNQDFRLRDTPSVDAWRRWVGRS